MGPAQKSPFDLSLYNKAQSSGKVETGVAHSSGFPGLYVTVVIMTENVQGCGARQRSEIDYNLLEKLLRAPPANGRLLYNVKTISGILPRSKSLLPRLTVVQALL